MTTDRDKPDSLATQQLLLAAHAARVQPVPLLDGAEAHVSGACNWRSPRSPPRRWAGKSSSAHA